MKNDEFSLRVETSACLHDRRETQGGVKHSFHVNIY